MHNPWLLTAAMAVIAIGTVGGVYLSTSGLANVSTASTSANRSNAIDQTVATTTPTGTPTATATPGPVRSYAAAPAMAIDPKQTYTATFTTSKGTFQAQLYANAAPKTVNSFVYLAEHHFYDGLEFDRVVPGFVIQGGDPNDNGTGGPGYTLPDEINDHPNDSGALAMANAGPGTDGSTFYINLQPNSDLNGRYTVFGQVTSGMDVVQAIGQTQRNPQDTSAPAVTIKSISVSPSGT
jgi:cyclophilin family peptidyl-prolyl cis-trans isomerase